MPARTRKPSQALLRILSANIVRLRDAKNWSQEELADEAGLHRTFVGSVERRERNVTLSTLEAFSAALNVSIIELLSKPMRFQPIQAHTWFCSASRAIRAGRATSSIRSIARRLPSTQRPFISTLSAPKPWSRDGLAPTAS